MLPLRTSVGIFLSALLALSILLAIEFAPRPLRENPSQAAAVITLGNPLVYSFNTSGVLYEAGSAEESTSPYWWLNSGGKMIMENYVGKTAQGNLFALDWWRLMYSSTNARDTDNGYHPQNTFRLVTKAYGGDTRVEALFKIERDNFSESSYRNASNGLLLMSKYIDSDTLYYAGIRVDGTAVIKKKYQGTYYTMAQEQIFPGEYVREKNMNLIPHREWIGLRSEAKRDTDGSMVVSLFMKRANEKEWKLILESRDDGTTYGGTPPITQIGRAGIRTDFMDVTFESFRMEAL